MIGKTNAVVGGGVKEEDVILDFCNETELIEGTLTQFTNSKLTSIGKAAFRSCASLASVNLPACAMIGNDAFEECTKLTSVNLPVCTSIGAWAFQSCYSLTSVSLPACTNVGSSAFYKCSSLQSVYIGASSVFNIHSAVFSGTSIKSTTGSIFVRSSLLDAFKAASGWSYFSNRIFSYNF